MGFHPWVALFGLILLLLRIRKLSIPEDYRLKRIKEIQESAESNGINSEVFMEWVIDLYKMMYLSIKLK
jgi:hypothetical protein